jgi:electron transfer flavoprotein beta subunit
VGVTLGDGVTVEVVRRLDGGRREVLRAAAPCVVTVEGGVARLRRAGLAATLRAADAPIEVIVADHGSAPEPTAVIRPYRPRARALAAPHGDTLDRLRQLTDAGGAPAHGERVTLDPPAAAARIVAALREWGYLD